MAGGPRKEARSLPQQGPGPQPTGGQDARGSQLTREGSVGLWEGPGEGRRCPSRCVPAEPAWAGCGRGHQAGLEAQIGPPQQA